MSEGWVIAQAAVVGTSHVRSALPCQDSCYASVEQTACGPALVALVSDGAGSARLGGEGAEVVMQTAAQWLAAELATRSLSEKLAVDCVAAVREATQRHAETRQATLRDCACTFIGVVATLSDALLIQVGDGGVVLVGAAGYDMPLWPNGGEYANETHFVTDDDVAERLQIAHVRYGPRRVALMSDGLQRLALNMATRSAHPPFFDPLFQVLAAEPPPAPEALDHALARYLDSDAVNKRTDDDKTLVLALRKDVCATC